MHVCNYFRVGPKWADFLGILPRVEWKAVREALAHRRNSLKDMSLSRLSKLTGLDKSTIHRIENVKKYPKHVPDFASVEKLAEALNLQLSLQIERQTEYPLQGVQQSATKGTVTRSKPNQQEVGADDRLVPTPQTRRDLLLDLGTALLDAAEHLPVQPRKQTATARPEPSAKAARARRSSR